MQFALRNVKSLRVMPGKWIELGSFLTRTALQTNVSEIIVSILSCSMLRFDFALRAALTKVICFQPLKRLQDLQML